MDASASASAMLTTSVTHFGQSEIGTFVFYGGAAIVLFPPIAFGLEAATKVASVLGRVMRKGEWP